MLGAAVFVDVGAVRLIETGRHFGSQFQKGLGGDAVGGAVGAIQLDLHPFQGVFLGEGALQKDDVPVPGPFDPVGLAQFLGGGVEVVHEVFQDQLFYLQLRFVGELVAVVGEDLDAVVLIGIVGGGDDDARIGPHALGEKGDARRGHDPHHDGVHPHGADAGNQGVFQHITGNAGVLADDDLGPVPLTLEIMGRRFADIQGQIRGHGVFVGHPPNSVRSKEFSHKRFLLDHELLSGRHIACAGRQVNVFIPLFSRPDGDDRPGPPR